MDNIALAFSGGGFRAAAFSLGCLSYLNNVQYKGKALLQYVTFISSTSGGSITNLLYSAYTYEGKPFHEVYEKLNSLFKGDELLSKALSHLKTQDSWQERPFKTKNLINAFSLEYDNFFEQRELGLFSNRQNNPHLKEICVNGTEFTNGYAFRFHSYTDTLGDENGLIGNFNIHFTNDDGKNGIAAAKKLKLADILASSSCFPSGFEPLLFPEDYATSAITPDELFNGLHFEANSYSLDSEDYNNTDFISDNAFKKEKQFGIMDGGVADNQAIDAFFLADARRTRYNGEPFSLFISCDVTSYFMDGYTLPVAKNKWYSFISLNTAKWFLICIISLIALWFPFSLIYFRSHWQWWNTLSSLVSATFFLPITGWLVSQLFKKKRTKESSWATVFNKHKSIFTSMSLARLKEFLLTRVKSVFILANDVYLKQIRRLYYERLYSDPDYKNRVIQNAIYDLSKAKFNKQKPIQTKPYDPPPPSDVMKDVAEKARTMGTTLWFDAHHERDKIKDCVIATGQFTTCYNLLKYIKKINHVKEQDDLTPEIKVLEQQLEEQYNAFLNNPMIMIS